MPCHVRNLYFFICLLTMSLLLSATRGICAGTARVYRVSIASNGAQAMHDSHFMSMSGDGRFVAFTTEAAALVPGYSSRGYDVYLYDRKLESTEIISGGLDGKPSDGGMCSDPSISADGRFVAFDGNARNLVPGDTNDAEDVFLRDRQTRHTIRISIGSRKKQANAWSAWPKISANGRYIAFTSGATNLVPNDTNGRQDIFLYDRIAGTTERISVASNGWQGNRNSHIAAISADGRYIAFTSEATNLVPGDNNGVCDVFLRDRVNRTTVRVSITDARAQANGPASHLAVAISADGQRIAFASEATNLVTGDTNKAQDIFIHDLRTRNTRRVSVATDGRQANNGSIECAISADGRTVVFRSYADNLAPVDANHADDIFLHDLRTGITDRVSIGPDGVEDEMSVGGYGAVGISADGRCIGFSSYAKNLVLNDTNNARDAFIADRGSP